jgi:hypothetical protein
MGFAKRPRDSIIADGMAAGRDWRKIRKAIIPGFAVAYAGVKRCARDPFIFRSENRILIEILEKPQARPIGNTWAPFRQT